MSVSVPSVRAQANFEPWAAEVLGREAAGLSRLLGYQRSPESSSADFTDGSDRARPRIAVVGTGWWSTQHHIPALTTYDGAELVALVDTAPLRLRAAMDSSGVPAGYGEVEELLSSTELDGVIVATTSATHYTVTKAVLEGRCTRWSKSRWHCEPATPGSS